MSDSAAIAPRPDRRRDRSERALTAALLALLGEVDWAEITVQAICDRADVARATFYARYDSKQDLLDALFAGMLVQVRSGLEKAAGTGPLPLLDWLVQHSHEGRGFSRRMRGTAGGALIQQRFRQSVGTLLAEDLARAGFDLDPTALAMVEGAAFGALDQWLALPAERAAAPMAMTAGLRARLLAVARALAGRQTPA